MPSYGSTAPFPDLQPVNACRVQSAGAPEASSPAVDSGMRVGGREDGPEQPLEPFGACRLKRPDGLLLSNRLWANLLEPRRMLLTRRPAWQEDDLSRRGCQLGEWGLPRDQTTRHYVHRP